MALNPLEAQLAWVAPRFEDVGDGMTSDLAVLLAAKHDATSLLSAIDRTATSRGRRSTGAVSAEGWRLLERALDAGRDVVAVAIGASALAAPSRDEARAVASARAAGVAVVAVHDGEIAARVGGRNFGAMLALVGASAGVWDGSGAQAILDHAVGNDVIGAGVVVVERVLDPGNLGTIARTAAALGYCGLIAVDGTDPMHPKALRTSMGALFSLPAAVWSGSLPSLLEAVHSAGGVTVAACLDGEPLAGFCARAALPVHASRVVLLGSEAHGLREETVRAATARVAIEMPGASATVDSLSVGAAAAVILWALRPATLLAPRSRLP